MFFHEVENLVGDQAGRHFAAITDDDTVLGKEAGEKGFRRVFVNP